MQKHIAFYKFVGINNLLELQQFLLSASLRLELKGTMLIAQEGINGCIVGKPEDIEKFKSILCSDARFSDLDFKESPSPETAFKRMLVKIKKEIISFGKPNIEPAHFTGEYVDAKTLKSWLDAGENVTLVDTRNDYEVKLGTFRGAIDPNIETFRQFPEWVDANLNHKKTERIVTFCTGGIRCEKATAYMRQTGFEQVYQLKGGILKYFEENKSEHYQGDCFVFDYRVALQGDLNTTSHDLCFACRMPLEPEELKHKLYVHGVQCQYCAQEQQEKQQKQLEKQKLHSALAIATRKKRSALKRAEVAKQRNLNHAQQTL